MQSLFIKYKNSIIRYLYFSGGDELLVCLHGFGEKAESFLPLTSLLKKKYSIIAIDMPFHGGSDWKEGLNVTIKDVAAIVNSIPELQEKQFSLMGYSMGGRIALHLYQQISQQIQQLILLAPDGFKMNAWYWLATQSNPGNKLFRYFMKKPGFFFSSTAALKKMRLINTGVYNYVHQYLQQKDKRDELYTIWTAMRNIRPNMHLIKSLIQQNGTPVTLIYGKYDRIIRAVTGKRFSESVGKNCVCYVLQCGHRLLHEKNAPVIASLINNQVG